MCLFISENGNINIIFEIENYSLLNNKNKLNKDLNLENKETFYNFKICNLSTKILINWKNKSLDELLNSIVPVKI